MKKILLATAMVLGVSYNASASGLYLGIGYSQSKPDINVNTLSGDSSDTGEYGVYEGYNELNGWPGSDYSNAEGLWAKPWEEGLDEIWKFYPEKTKTYSFSVGWAIPQNPFRFELELLKTSFNASNWDMIIKDPDGAWCSNNTCTGDEFPTDQYVFDLAAEGDWEVRSFDIKSYMLNVLFEIPGFGNVDPYVGFGYGFTKLDTELDGIKGGTKDNQPTQQYIVGVEYRVPDSPLIVGLEYKKLKMDEGEERDDAFTSFEYKQDIIMFKLRYDFISDII